MFLVFYRHANHVYSLGAALVVAGLNNHCLVMFGICLSDIIVPMPQTSDVRRQQLGILPDSANRQGQMSRRYRTKGYECPVPSEKIDCHQKQPFNAHKRCASTFFSLSFEWLVCASLQVCKSP